jgi:hypothetical protein
MNDNTGLRNFEITINIIKCNKFQRYTRSDITNNNDKTDNHDDSNNNSRNKNKNNDYKNNYSSNV